MPYAIRVLYKSNEAPWSGGYDPSPYGPKNDGEAVEWAVRMQEGLGDLYAVTLTRDGQVMALPESPTPNEPDDPFAPERRCDCVGPNEAEPQPCRCGRK